MARLNETFEIAIKSEVSRIGGRTGLSESKAFLVWFAKEIFDITEETALEAVSIEGANDKGIDLFWVDEEDRRVIILQGKFSASLRHAAKERDFSALESSIKWLNQPEALRREGRSELASAAEEYQQAVTDGYSVELWFVYTGPKSANVDKQVSVYNQDVENIERRRAARHYDLSLIKASWEEIHGGSRRLPGARLAAVERPFTHSGSFGDAVVATISASELVRLYEEHGERLFDRNVRLFLGSKGPVNAAIAATLSDSDQRGNFWAYNNGVTFLCDSVKASGRTIRVKNFSIVNGCQTTVSLFQNKAESEEAATVLVKFIAASNEIVDDVITFTNSQNAIRPWDIASQDRTQRRLKKEFHNALKNPYIYLTRRGDKPSGDLSRYKEDGRTRLIKIDVVGQYAAAYRGNPVVAWKHKAFIFSKFHDDFFPPDVRVEEVLFQWVCGEIVRRIVTDSIKQYEPERDEFRILTKGGALFVLAVLSRIALLRNGPAYLRSIGEDRIRSTRTAEKLEKYAAYALLKYVDAVLELSGSERKELHTLLRNPEFWERVIKKIERDYAREALAKEWLKEALPPLF